MICLCKRLGFSDYSFFGLQSPHFSEQILISFKKKEVVSSAFTKLKLISVIKLL